MLQQTPTQPNTQQTLTQPSKTNGKNMLHTVCNQVNDRVHSAIDKILQQKPVDLSTIDFEQEIANWIDQECIETEVVFMEFV